MFPWSSPFLRMQVIQPDHIHNVVRIPILTAGFVRIGILTHKPEALPELDKNLSRLNGIAGVNVHLGDLAGNGRRDHRLHFHGFQYQ
jgi:hypothetical protein